MTTQQEESKETEKASLSVHDALALAATEGDLALVKKLLEEWIEKNPNWRRRYSSSRGKNCQADLNYYFHRAFDAAAEKDDFEILTYFMQQGFTVHDKAARSATSNRSYRALDLFLRYGWDINMRRWKFYPPILCYAVYQDDAAFVQWLLDYGASADVPPNDESDRNPLMTAASSASFEILKMLIAYGARADRGDVILFLAWPDCQDRAEKFQYLIDRGAPINQLEHSQCPSQFRMHSRLGLGTPLHKAVRTGEFDFAATLLAHGADLSIRDTKGKTPLDLARELERPEMVALLIGAQG